MTKQIMEKFLRNDPARKLPDYSRRQLMLSGIALAAGLTLGRTLMAATLSTPNKLSAPNKLSSPNPKATVQIENFYAAGNTEGLAELPRIVKTDDEWDSQLSAMAYEVTRKEGTERPFSGQYAKNHAAGIYRCICCNTALFDAQTKFESGTGWPSFWQPISRFNVTEISDSTFGMQRVAVSCTRCDAHLGHVFNDGPKPTGLRYCMNSVALNFIAQA